MARRPAPRRKAGGKRSQTRDYAAEYKRRVKGTRKGSPERQQKRGHTPPPGKTEAGARRQREVESGQGTTYERRRTRELADRQFKRIPPGHGRTREQVRAFFDRILRDKGYPAIKHIQTRLAALKANRARRIRRNGKLITVDFSAKDRAIADMQDLVDEYGTEDDDFDLFFYN